MSSNDQLVILKIGRKFEVHHNICVDNDFECSADTFLRAFAKLEKAIKWANKYCNENIVEYGVYVDI